MHPNDCTTNYISSSSVELPTFLTLGVVQCVILPLYVFPLCQSPTFSIPTYLTLVLLVKRSCLPLQMECDSRTGHLLCQAVSLVSLFGVGLRELVYEYLWRKKWRMMNA